ncbi:MAG TPA: hypothetical protein DCY13_06475 [Verrucomicrobiales bacterium]|nr:hypothetical protein [Verrucomicrobiales bacterium]
MGEFPTGMTRPQQLPRGPFWLMAGFVLLVLLLVAFAYGQFNYVNVCIVCGKAQHALDYQVPMVRWTLYTVQYEEETSLSAVLDEQRFVGVHEHQWRMVTGDGNGVALLLGDGHRVATSLISPSMGPFVEAMLGWTDRETTERWVDRLRNPADAHLCRSLSELSRLEEFNSRDEWEHWLAETEARIAPQPQ